MQSNVGNSQIYNDGDQRNPRGTNEKPSPYHAGKEHSHNDLDSKDERSIANRLAAATTKSKWDVQKTVDDPLAPATSQGHEPSHGAKVDAELQREDEEYLKQKQA